MPIGTSQRGEEPVGDAIEEKGHSQSARSVIGVKQSVPLLQPEDLGAYELVSECLRIPGPGDGFSANSHAQSLTGLWRLT
jgi:hypothetical protein